MRIKTVESVKPSKGMVLVELQKIESNSVILDSNIDSQNVEELALYKGKILKYASGSKRNSYEIKKGKIALFTEFAGYHVPVVNKPVKIINTYDILAYTDTMDITTKGVTPSNDRILVSTYTEDVSVVLENTSDPRDVALKFGKVETIGYGCTNDIEVGAIVAFENYSGEIVHKDSGDGTPELTVLLESLILFSVKK